MSIAFKSLVKILSSADIEYKLDRQKVQVYLAKQGEDLGQKAIVFKKIDKGLMVEIEELVEVNGSQSFEIGTEKVKVRLMKKLDSSYQIWKSNWQKLRWRAEARNKEANRERQTIEVQARQWQASHGNSDYLLRGAALTKAQEFYIRYGEQLSLNAEKFIIKSIQIGDREVKSAKRRRQVIVGSWTGAILMMLSILELPRTSMNTLIEPEAVSKIKIEG